MKMEKEYSMKSIKIKINLQFNPPLRGHRIKNYICYISINEHDKTMEIRLKKKTHTINH